jgi:Protein of unknown function (DUF1566)
MRNQSRCTRMWSVMVAGLSVLWFTAPAGAIPLESWDDKIPSATTRFKVLTEFNGEAVLDKETGLVWERTPAIISPPWKYGRFECASRTTGNRKGWRLPSVHELASLLDPSPGVTPPLLPPGHPFTTGTTGVQSAIYWSATTIKAIPSNAWGVNFSNGEVTDFGDVTVSGKLHWCVRGGQNHGDEY